MRELLSTRGYRASIVNHAEEAETEILREPPDLILLDVVMPGKSGYDLCRELKEDPSTRLIPIVLITGLSDRQDRLRGIEAGADDFLNKPIFPEELFARVKSLLKLKEFTDELENAESVLCTLGLSVEDATLTPRATANGWLAKPLIWASISDSTANRSWRCAEADIFTTSAKLQCPMKFKKRLQPHSIRVGNHEEASPHRGKYLQAAEVVAACVADHPQPP